MPEDSRRAAVDSLVEAVSSRISAGRIGTTILYDHEKQVLSDAIGQEEVDIDRRLGSSFGPLLYVDSDDVRDFLFGLADRSREFAYALGVGAASYVKQLPQAEFYPSFHVSEYESRRWLATLQVSEFAGRNRQFADGFQQGTKTQQ